MVRDRLERIAAKTCLSDKSELLAFLGNAFAHIVGQIVSVRVKAHSNTNSISSFTSFLMG